MSKNYETILTTYQQKLQYRLHMIVRRLFLTGKCVKQKEQQKINTKKKVSNMIPVLPP